MRKWYKQEHRDFVVIQRSVVFTNAFVSAVGTWYSSSGRGRPGRERSV